MDEKKGGMSFCGTLTLIFVVLKLCHVIDWGWVWVLSPIWIPIILLVLLVIIKELND